MKKRFPVDSFLHPFFISLYAVLSLWLANIDQVQLFTLTRPLLYAIAFTLAAVLAGLAIFLKPRKASIFASHLLVLFYLYGHVFALIDMKSIFGVIVGRHRYTAPLWLFLLVLGFAWIWRSRSDFSTLGKILNISSAFLVAMVLVQGIFLTLKAGKMGQPGSTAVDSTAVESIASGLGINRDVYYIILDAYARQDVLASKHHVDIQPFVRQLAELGFTVLPCTQSNYVWTPQSLGSSLNMNYLDALGVPMDAYATRINYWDFSELLSHSLVRQMLEARGYKTVTFKSVYSWMDITDSDYFFDVEKSASFFDRQETINFHYLFLRTTALRLIIEAYEHSPEKFEKLPPFLLRLFNPKASLLSSRHFKQYEQNLFALKSLAEIPQIPGPKFVYAHLFVTHQPYVFNVDGSLRWPPVENMQAYADQVIYANSRMIQILEKIIRDSEIPPVIILQGDHGYLYNQDRVKILNAYYLPDHGSEKLYPTMTPVNTFRLIFNLYFDSDFEMLPDTSYHSYNSQPYLFDTVPNTCRVEPQ